MPRVASAGHSHIALLGYAIERAGKPARRTILSPGPGEIRESETRHSGEVADYARGAAVSITAVSSMQIAGFCMPGAEWPVAFTAAAISAPGEEAGNGAGFQREGDLPESSI